MLISVIDCHFKYDQSEAFHPLDTLIITSNIKVRLWKSVRRTIALLLHLNMSTVDWFRQMSLTVIDCQVKDEWNVLFRSLETSIITANTFNVQLWKVIRRLFLSIEIWMECIVPSTWHFNHYIKQDQSSTLKSVRRLNRGQLCCCIWTCHRWLS